MLGLSLGACGPGARDGMGDDDGRGSGSGSGSGSDVPRQCNKMDIVFVVDDSGSMAEEQQNLATNFPMFADLLANYVTADGEKIDFRVAVTTTGRDEDYTISVGGTTLPTHEDGDNGAFRDTCGNAKRFLDTTDANLNSTLACRANVGTGGPSYEMPLLMSKWALSERIMDGTNAGFLRDDALLAIVYLTDENDSSTDTNNWVIGINGGDPTPTWQPADQVAFLDALKGNRTRWAAGVIAGDGDCSSSFGMADDATRLKEFVTLANANGTTQAVFSSICAGDLTIGLKSALDTFQAACGNIIY
ncbi:MAG TPA: hypothetical protein VFQ53_21580 [Kofleriaceae bacterium]|nr:hypothetical protein [Kofleriaceae bacterium]